MDKQTNKEINNLRNEILLIQKVNFLKPSDVRHDSSQPTNLPSETFKAAEAVIY